jgi:hypothetical protein
MSKNNATITSPRLRWSRYTTDLDENKRMEDAMLLTEEDIGSPFLYKIYTYLSWVYYAVDPHIQVTDYFNSVELKLMVDRLYNDEYTCFRHYFRRGIRYSVNYNGYLAPYKEFYESPATSIANLLEKSFNCSNNITYGELMALECVLYKNYAYRVFSPNRVCDHYGAEIRSYCYINPDTGGHVIQYKKRETQLYEFNMLFNQMGNKIKARRVKLTNMVMEKFNIDCLEIKEYVGAD